MPTARYQHGAVFVNARLHISGGAVGGGRMVDDAAPVVVLDTAAGVWCTQAPATGPSANGAESHEWARRCATSLHPHWQRNFVQAASVPQSASSSGMAVFQSWAAQVSACGGGGGPVCVCVRRPARQRAAG